MSEEHLCTLCISIIEFDGPDPGGLGVLLSSSRLGILVALVPLGSHLVTHLLHLHTANQMSDCCRWRRVGVVWAQWRQGRRGKQKEREREIVV